MELLTDKVIYHTETQEDYDDLMEKLEELGYKWGGNRNATNLRDIWAVFKEESHIRLYPDKTLNCIDSHCATTYLSEYKIIKYKKDKKEHSMKVKLKASEKFVADWYEENKSNLEFNIFEEFMNLHNRLSDEYDDFLLWLENYDIKPIQTLINMHQFGYELEEKLYYVELPVITDEQKRPQRLCKIDKNYFIAGGYKQFKHTFTKDEIIKNVPWAWQFVKEVN